MKYYKSLSKFLALLLLSLSLASGCGQQKAADSATAPTRISPGVSQEAEDIPDASLESEGALKNSPSALDYSNPANWANLESEEVPGKEADVFFICPSVYGGSPDACNMSLSDEDTKESFAGAINMEKGIYDDNCRFFAPYYRQIGLNVYEMEEADREPYLAVAYFDAKAAFEYYMEHYNNGRPIILAGFSQGADLCIRLMKDCFAGEDRMAQLVACYAIGWRITSEELEQYPHLKVASGEWDTGVIVSFNSEAEEVSDSLIIPEGVKTLAINPLNWKTDSTPADKSQNLGACFTDYSGEITSEIPELTGAYIDSERGALKVTDVTPQEYPAGLSIFEDGVYHLYDYQFFYRNLEENVGIRIQAFLGR